MKMCSCKCVHNLHFSARWQIFFFYLEIHTQTATTDNKCLYLFRFEFFLFSPFKFFLRNENQKKKIRKSMRRMWENIFRFRTHGINSTTYDSKWNWAQDTKFFTVIFFFLVKSVCRVKISALLSLPFSRAHVWREIFSRLFKITPPR